MHAWRGEPVALVQALLATTPEAAYERLPLVDPESGCVLVASARIDNRPELRRALAIEGDSALIPDGAFLLAAYKQWGLECASHLVGDFAFAIWDPSYRRLFCARDLFGVRPFYYYFSPEKLFAFGSEYRPIFSLGETPLDLNDGKIADFMDARIDDDHDRTFYKHIFRLPGGHSLVLNSNGMQIRPFASLEPDRELRLSSNEAYAEAYREKFSEAIGSLLRANTRVGCQLSGGLDSSSVACVAGDLLRAGGQAPLKTFSCVFPEVQRSDETEFIKIVLEHGSFEPYFMHGDRERPLDGLEEMLRILEVPCFAPNLFVSWGLHRMAAKQSIRVMLDGFVGDSTVSHGWEYFTELAHELKLMKLARLMGSSQRRLGEPYARKYLNTVWRYGIKTRIPGWIKQALRPIVRSAPPRPSRSTILRAEFAEAVNHLRVRTKGELIHGVLSARELHCQTLKSGAIPMAMEILDRSKGAHGVEARFPYLDRRLVEFCVSLPAEQKLLDAWPRSIARRALAGTLPEQIRWRSSKGDISHNLRHVLLETNRDQLESALFSDTHVLNPYVDMERLREAFRGCSAGMGNLNELGWLQLAASLACWLRMNKPAPRLQKEHLIESS